MVHLPGLEKGAHEGDCNLLINRCITAGRAGAGGSRVGSFSDRAIWSIPQPHPLFRELLAALGILFGPSGAEEPLRGPQKGPA